MTCEISKKLRSHRLFKPLLAVVLALLFLGLAMLINNFSKQVVNRTEAPIVNPLPSASGEINEELVQSISEGESGFNDLFIFFSPDGQKVAYAVSKDDGWALSVNGVTGPAFDSLSDVVFSPDSEHFAYTGRKEAKEFVVIDHEIGPGFDWTFDPKGFSPDSRFFIYKARRDGRDLMMINDWASQLYDEIYKVSFAPDYSQVFIFARRDKEIWRLSIELDEEKVIKKN